MNSLTSGSSPELRVVASTLSANSISTEKRFTSGVVMPAPMRGTSERALMHRGVEALARYSYSHADDSPTPWEESIQAPSSESWREREQRMVATTAVRVLSIDEASNVAWGATAFSASRTLDAHSGVAWSAAGSRNEASLEKMGEGSTISIVRTLARATGPVLEMADALRALRLNQVRVGDGLTLKLDGRTGRHARAFAILTQRF